MITPPIGSREDCRFANFSATPITESIVFSFILTSEDASPIAFIASKNATPSVLNLSIEVPPKVKMVKISAIDVPTVVSAISPITPISFLTPSKDSPFIPDALSLATFSWSINSEISSPILTKLSLNPSPIPPMKFPTIVPMLPANCSSTGSPVSKNFCILGNFSISAPMPVAKSPIAANRTTKEPTPITAAGPNAPIIVSAPRSKVIAVIAVTSALIFSDASSIPFISLRT